MFLNVSTFFRTRHLAKDNLKIQSHKKRTEIDSGQLEKELSRIQHAIDFLKFRDPFEVKEESNPILDYCKYEPHAVYKYKTFNDGDFNDMLDIMTKDVINTYHELIANNNNTLKTI